MTDHPVFIETADGTLGGIVSAPDGDPVAAVVILDGLGATRAGANQVWARTARALAAEAGTVVLRTDWSGISESHEAPFSARVESTRTAVRWFRDQVPGLDLLVVGFCYGVMPAVDLAKREPGVRGIALVTPPVWEDPEATASLGRRIHVALYRRKKALGRLALTARYGRFWPKRFDNDGAEFGTLSDELGALADVAPLWLLAGEDDAIAPRLRELEPLLAGRDARLELVPGALYPTPTPDAQQTVIERSVEWARRCTAPAEVAG
jgi:alpha/beta superfamily hydrolase